MASMPSHRRLLSLLPCIAFDLRSPYWQLMAGQSEIGSGGQGRYCQEYKHGPHTNICTRNTLMKIFFITDSDVAKEGVAHVPSLPLLKGDEPTFLNRWEIEKSITMYCTEIRSAFSRARCQWRRSLVMEESRPITHKPRRIQNKVRDRVAGEWTSGGTSTVALRLYCSHESIMTSISLGVPREWRQGWYKTRARHGTCNLKLRLWPPQFSSVFYSRAVTQLTNIPLSSFVTPTPPGVAVLQSFSRIGTSFSVLRALNFRVLFLGFCCLFSSGKYIL